MSCGRSQLLICVILLFSNLLQPESHLVVTARIESGNEKYGGEFSDFREDEKHTRTATMLRGESNTDNEPKTPEHKSRSVVKTSKGFKDGSRESFLPRTPAPLSSPSNSSEAQDKELLGGKGSNNGSVFTSSLQGPQLAYVQKMVDKPAPGQLLSLLVTNNGSFGVLSVNVEVPELLWVDKKNVDLEPEQEATINIFSDPTNALPVPNDGSVKISILSNGGNATIPLIYKQQWGSANESKEATTGTSSSNTTATGVAGVNSTGDGNEQTGSGGDVTNGESEGEAEAEVETEPQTEADAEGETGEKDRESEGEEGTKTETEAETHGGSEADTGGGSEADTGGGSEADTEGGSEAEVGEGNGAASGKGEEAEGESNPKQNEEEPTTGGAEGKETTGEGEEEEEPKVEDSEGGKEKERSESGEEAETKPRVPGNGSEGEETTGNESRGEPQPEEEDKSKTNNSSVEKDDSVVDDSPPTPPIATSLLQSVLSFLTSWFSLSELLFGSMVAVVLFTVAIFFCCCHCCCKKSRHVGNVAYQELEMNSKEGYFGSRVSGASTDFSLALGQNRLSAGRGKAGAGKEEDWDEDWDEDWEEGRRHAANEGSSGKSEAGSQSFIGKGGSFSDVESAPGSPMISGVKKAAAVAKKKAVASKLVVSKGRPVIEDGWEKEWEL